MDVEWIALAAGVKPAIRLLARSGEVDAIAARYLGRGAAVVCSHPGARLHGEPVDIVYVAREELAARELREVEHPLLLDDLPSSATQREAHRELGARLGFPACCVERFCARVERGVDRLDAGDARGFAEDYVAARSAACPHPDARLDNLLLAAGVRLVTFYPCRFDCPRALTYADALLVAIERRRPGASTALIAALAHTIVIAPNGARAVVHVDERDEIVRAVAPFDRRRGNGSPADLALAASVVGAKVTARGALETAGTAGELPWVLAFSKD